MARIFWAANAQSHNFESRIVVDISKLTGSTKMTHSKFNPWSLARSPSLRSLENDLSVSDNVTGGIVENCGHLLPEEAPEFLAAQMNEFFQSHQ